MEAGTLEVALHRPVFLHCLLNKNAFSFVPAFLIQHECKQIDVRGRPNKESMKNSTVG